ncbi:hypothetical protein [Rhodococcus globerulus]|uniref:Uncharacterized protein n=1 Tax=Rhodococcus globerulus TaxID=33008 RepID=A0ABU4BST8_RHOGO|nr:hypothetical protein [Rhodococcus globerulus]MDV6267271.1 hypothetical protein [Rhodococcus globerulus]
MTEQEPRRGLDRLIHLDWMPSRLFGGRMRTSTFILVVAWILAYVANAYLNPAEPTVATPAPAAGSSVTEPYTQPPVATTTTAVPESSTPPSSESVPSTTVVPGSATPDSAQSGVSTTVTTTAPPPGPPVGNSGNENSNSGNSNSTVTTIPSTTAATTSGAG